MRWLAALALMLAPVALHAEERIRDFNSDVRIAQDGTLTVTETIKLVSEGNEIKRGINRDFPTRYRNRFGQTTRVTFAVDSVTRDGKPEPYTVSGLGNGERVRIGQADVFLENGDHTYVITYRTSRQLHFDKDFDELYWNATGTGWTFPIDFASARFALPTPAKFGQRAAYTGVQGSTENAAEVWDEGPGFIAWRTTRALGIGEGLTVAAAFPKGVVTPPSGAAQAGWWLQDWGPFAAGLIALAALLFYQARAWWVAGRGPRAGTVVPLFTPPDGLSAAATRYIARMGMDNRAFTAAVVDSAVAGYVHVDKQDGGWFASDTTTLRETPSDKPLPQAERNMVGALFENFREIELKQKNYATFQAARKALSDAFDAAYLDKLFKKNTSWAVFGLLAIPVAMFAIAIVAALVGVTGPGGFTVPLSGLVAVVGAFVAWHATRDQKGCLVVLAWLVMIGCIFTIFGTAFASLALALEGGAWAILLPLLSLPVALFAFKWMEAPTAEGRQVMDRIAGFKHYLGITEEERLDRMNPPEKTPELFERYLPYAIALDVENRWADKFAGVLAAAAATAGTTSTMAWYSGQGNVWHDPGGFASSVGDSLASSISSASASPSSSSGSGGGGSSGGGGGGGGGSGW